MIQYTQTTGKIVSTDEITIKECIKRNQDTIDRRFCFDIVAQPEILNSNHHHHHHSGHNHSATTNGGGSNSGSVGNNMAIQKHSNNSQNTNSSSNDGSAQVVIYTFQAISEEDYKYWLETLNARDPYPTNLSGQKSGKQNSNKINSDNLKNTIDSHLNETYQLDAEGYWFVKKCIRTIESHGLDQKGIYRMVGVASRVRTLMDMFAQSKSINQNHEDHEHDIDRTDLLPNFNVDSEDFETKTLTSALKSYLRNLAEPIMTFQLHHLFITAASMYCFYAFYYFESNLYKFYSFFLY